MKRERKRPSKGRASSNVLDIPNASTNNTENKIDENKDYQKYETSDNDVLYNYRKQGIPSLSDASEKRNLEALKYFLTNIEDIEYCTPLEEWFRALYEAVKNRYSEIIAYLLENDKEGDYLYYKRLNYSHFDFSNLYYGSLYLDECYPCELHIASKMGYIDIVKMLVEYNKVCEVEYNKSNNSWRSFTYNHIREEEYINLKDKEGNTALLYAVQNNHEDIVKYLVQKGSKLDVLIHGNKLNSSVDDGCSSEYSSNQQEYKSIYDSEYYNNGLDIDQQEQDFWEDIL